MDNDDSAPKTKKTRPKKKEVTPTWVNDTPEYTYHVSMYEWIRGTVQEIKLSREEYKQVKELIAEKRGYQLPSSPPQESAA